MPIAAKETASPFVPNDRSLPVLREAVQHCRGCDLDQHATQAVFGEREAADHGKISVVMIGEQPGDQEDKQGHPFVGPSGKLLNQCLAEAGIDRRQVYVTNTVKHFKWEPRGKMRIHKKPTMREIRACRPWLDAELDTLQPDLIVCLGAVAAQSLLGSSFKITQSHGQLQHMEGYPPILATLHPSAILRARTEEDRARDTGDFIQDLRQVKAILER